MSGAITAAVIVGGATVYAAQEGGKAVEQAAGKGADTSFQIVTGEYL